MLPGKIRGLVCVLKLVVDGGGNERKVYKMNLSLSCLVTIKLCRIFTMEWGIPPPEEKKKKRMP